VALNVSLTDPAADSYITLEDADSYFSGGLWSDAWAAVENQEAALREAARWLNTLSFPGECCVAGRYLAWPRSGAECCCEVSTCGAVPLPVAQAQAELALQLGTNPGLLIGGVGVAQVGGRGPVKRQKLGDLEQEFFDPRDGGAVVGEGLEGQPTLIQKLPWLADVLGCWLKLPSTGGSRIIARVRS
jgi:hypothetical protein